ncbi:MFS transporter [Microbacterium sp. Ru50]|uniref:MFS transporter n=1 Tax=Microbacterium sp. Ru50 TaxID=2080744 RepID=UPI0015E1E19F|nr:MFS transporter [Microbacterium sp. Ru50]
MTPEPAAAGGPDGRRSLPLRLPWSLGSGTILLGLNSSIIAVALVPMVASFGGDAADATTATAWIISALYIAAAVGSPTAGRLADLYGPRRVYLAGLALILVASVAGPFIADSGWMIVDRVVLGLGAAAQFPAAMAIIRRQADLARATPTGAIGIIALCGQTTAALGPTVGGLVVVAWGWPGIFWVNIPMVILCATLVLAFVPADARGPRASAAQTWRALDPAGMVLMIGTLVALMVALLSIDSAPTVAVVSAAVTVPLASGFVWRELRAERPFVDVRLLGRYPQFGLTCLRAIATFISFYVIFYGLPQWMQATRDLGPAVTGLLMLPVFGVGALSTVLATRLGRTWHPRALLAVGTSAMVLAGTLLALTGAADMPLWVLAIVCALLGVPNGFNNLGNQLLLHHAVPAGAAGASTGIYRTAQYVGAALAAVVVAHLLDAGAVAGGIRDVGLTIAGLGLALLLATVVAVIRLRRKEAGA